MSTKPPKPERQDTVIGHPKSHYRNIRFDPQTYETIRQLSQELGWVFSKVVGEAVAWYIGMSPILQRLEKKSQLLAGKPFIAAHVKEFLEELDTQLDEAILESTVPVPTDYPKPKKKKATKE